MTDDTRTFAELVNRIGAGADHFSSAAQLVATMTVEEKLGCLDGDTDFWAGLQDMTSGGYHSHPWPAAKVPRLGIPGIDFVDGPRGSVIGSATCFPVSMSRGASFNIHLEEQIGEAIGKELRAMGATFTGAVCLNLLRHPAWGRAQETFGEDPHHVGEMAAATTRGLQRHVMACMKHFVCNSMENQRFFVDVTADDRSLHEVYLPHFRRVASEGVASVMSAYNSVNGTHCGDNHDLLTGVLRDEWGWDGFVITDFTFGIRDAVESVLAGCEIEMPFRQLRDQVLADAVADGRLPIEVVDVAVTRIVATLARFWHVFANQPDRSVLACAEHRALGRRAAVEGTVLLHNNGVLPVDGSKLSKVAVIGELAGVPNLGDGGSSDVYPPEVVTVIDGLTIALPNAEVVHSDADPSIGTDADLTVVVVGLTKFDEGEYLDVSGMAPLFALFPPRPELSETPEPHPDQTEKELPSAAEAQEARPESGGPARESEQVGSTPAGFSPGGDRRNLSLNERHVKLIDAAIAASRGPVVVVVMGGSAVTMPWIDSADAVLNVWYPGMDGGHAVAEMILGSVEPSGRLPFALPRSEADLVDFDPDAKAVTYDGLHGQWYLDANGVEAHFPFGFGLGYTTFEMGDDPSVDADGVTTVAVSNVGARSGSTVVFLFGSKPNSEFTRPQRRLVGFAKVSAEAGETVDVSIPPDWSMLDVRSERSWFIEPGEYQLSVGFDANPAQQQVLPTLHR